MCVSYAPLRIHGGAFRCTRLAASVMQRRLLVAFFNLVLAVLVALSGGMGLFDFFTLRKQ